MGHALLTELLSLLGLSVVAVATVSWLRLPSVIGYLFVGVFVGPHAIGLIEHSETTHTLGEVGVAFLLFAIGLEFSIPQFLKMRHVLVWLGATQVILGTVSGAAIAMAIGMPMASAIIVGGALSMSSTAIVIKQLTDQGELALRHGNLSLGVLLFQDLAAVPFLVIIPLLADPSEQAMLTVLGIALMKGAAVFAVMLLLGVRILRPLFQKVANTQSPELFTLTVLFVSSCAAWFTNAVGLSLALGAFIAGMMLSETEFRHHIDNELRPFRDLLLGVFFITVGMQLDLIVIFNQLHWIALLVFGLTIGKGGLIALLTFAYNKNTRVASRVGMVLGHGGEFGLALLALALSTGIVESTDNQIILASIVISMFIAPLLVRYNESLSARFEIAPPDVHDRVEEIAASTEKNDEHVIIFGFGRVGSQMAGILKEDQVQYVALDNNPQVVKIAWEDDEPVYYGDGTNPHVLHALGINRASAVVISFNDEDLAVRVLQQIKTMAPNIPVLVRSYDDSSLHRLLAAGASEVLPETFETSLMLTLNLLLTLGFSEQAVDDRLHRERERHREAKVLRGQEE
ncbi:MAG: cation:proton antiporter [Pseudomonadota bacterium]